MVAAAEAMLTFDRIAFGQAMHVAQRSDCARVLRIAVIVPRGEVQIMLRSLSAFHDQSGFVFRAFGL